MKTNIFSIIASKEQAIAYLHSLVENEEAYHPEDDAQDVEFNSINPTWEERNLLNLRMEEVYYFIADPCKIVMDKLTEINSQSYKHFNERFEDDGQDPEYYDGLL